MAMASGKLAATVYFSRFGSGFAGLGLPEIKWNMSASSPGMPLEE
jgi:hypothetical protein